MSRAAECFRVSGGGNDFLALVEPDAPPSAERIRAWCTRGLSLGADGLFTLSRTPDGLRMDYFNADGHAADLCLNGTRCAARLAGHLGWHEGAATILTGAGAIQGRVSGDRVRLELAPPAVRPRALEPTVGGTTHKGWFLEVGVPQFVLPWADSLSHAPVLELGAEIRRHPAFGRPGTNVMFVRFLPPAHFEIRSYERGVEAETLACGTGVLAAAAVALDRGWLELPMTALTAGGCTFEVDGALDDEGWLRQWSLSGEARVVARIEPLDGAERVPHTPTWT